MALAALKHSHALAPACERVGDVIVADIDAPWVLDPAELKSKCKNTPFDEARLQGRVLRTIVAGRMVFEYAAVS